MAKFVWMTDIHLDCLGQSQIIEWCQKVKQNNIDCEGVLITGDIALAPILFASLRTLREHLEMPLWFVCGNHDFWDGSIVEIRKEILKGDLAKDGIVWLGGVEYVPFGESIALVGHDGWYDALNGDPKKSRFVMNDWFRTEEFSGNLHNVVSTARKLAAGAVTHIENACNKAIDDGRTKIIMLTHFPPFAESCFYRGQRTHEHALPWYSSRMMGEALSLLSEKHPAINFTVLCGHTHSFSDIAIRPNLRVVVGNSDYGSPDSNMIGVTE